MNDKSEDDNLRAARGIVGWCLVSLIFWGILALALAMVAR